VAQGAIGVDGRALAAGDALGFVDEARQLALAGRGADVADVLLFDLPG
jgi:VanZ family protein